MPIRRNLAFPLLGASLGALAIGAVAIVIRMIGFAGMDRQRVAPLSLGDAWRDVSGDVAFIFIVGFVVLLLRERYRT